MNRNLNKYVIVMAMVIVGLAAGSAHADVGNSCANAYTISGMPFSDFEQISMGDTDYYKIILGSAGVLTVYTDWYWSIDPEGALLNSGCGLIEENQDISWPSSPNFRIQRTLEAGTYYVRIKAESSLTQGWYRFRAEFQGVSNHIITASAGTGGSIAPSGTVNVPHGGNQAFTIASDPCYVISDVKVDGISHGPQNDYVFTNVTADHTIQAFFAPSGTFTISASAETGGTITPSGTLNVPCGADQAFSITADAGYEILDVLVDGISWTAISSYTFTNVGEAHTILVRFQELSQHTITTIPGDNGSISPAGPISVYPGGSATVTFVPDSGYSVEEVWVDGVSQGAINKYTFTNVQADHTVEAHYQSGGGSSGSGCMDISDTPLDARFRAAPPIVMFVIDDSGSMDWEVMTSESHSRFGDEGIAYVFDDPGDNFYNTTYGSQYGKILTGDQRKDWKAQWSGYNKMYYNPLVQYEPWPNMAPADTTAPRSHPMVAGVTMTLADTYLEMTDKDDVIVDDGDSGFSVTGGWTYVNNIYGYSSDYRYSTLLQEDKTARWTPNLTAGDYKIYARWVNTGNNASSVVYKIYDSTSDGSSNDKTVNQSANFGVWNYIDTTSLYSSGYVKIELGGGDAAVKSAVADAVKFVSENHIDISNAHYYTWNDSDDNGQLDSGETVYLVNFVDDNHNGVIDGRDWYVVNDNGDDHIQLGELAPISESSVPGSVRPRSWSDDLQNFANWYSYYRRRELSAKAAVAGVIDQASRMLIGLYSINALLNQPVRKVAVDGVDERDALLTALYNAGVSPSGTPLRKGLLNAGKYLDKSDGGETGGIGASPYYSAENGGECQQAFVVLMTDGYYNGAAPTIGNIDGSTSDPYTLAGSNAHPYTDTYANTLADVAMYFYARDLVADDDLKDYVPTNERDSAGHQHMVTYGVGFGVSGTLSPDEYDETLKHKTTGLPIQWPDPNPTLPDADADKKKIDDLYHAAVNGRGMFMVSSDVLELLNSLMMVLKDIEYYAGSGSAVSVNGDELYTRINNNVRLFQSKYYSESWHGDVLSFKVNQTSGAVVYPAVWSAAEQLNLKDPDDRLIATSDGKSIGKPFRFEQINNAMKAMLDSDDQVAEKMLDYIRGDAGRESANGGTFRNRTWRISDQNHPLTGKTILSSKLGDVVHSSPVYNRGALYTGGNDGMLHAFNAETGEEIFGYVPYLVFENLKYLAGPSYDHKYYVDLTPTVADVQVGETTVMLVGGLGKGGKGYYALDISNVNPTTNSLPSNESHVKNMVMWEYPDNDTPLDERVDMGYSYSRPTVAKSHDTDSAPWIVIFGNGYVSDNQSAVLFILDPENGHLLKKIDTGATGCNGLSTPMAVDVDYDDVVDYVYAGDLRGNLWKFDLTSDNYNDWDVAFFDGSTPKPLFRSPGQPITTRPDVMYHCSKHGYIVYFGTGKYLEESDLTDTSLQSLYALWDYGDDMDDVENVGDWDIGLGTLTNANLISGVTLQAQTVTAYTVNGKSVRVTSENVPYWTLSNLSGGGLCGDYGTSTICDQNGIGTHGEPIVNAGWRMDLPGGGERIVSDVLVRDGKLLALSYIPGGSLCGTGGVSWLMLLNACTGSRLGQVNFDLNDDGQIESTDDSVTVDGTKLVPSGISFDGRLQPPAIILMGDGKEMLYMSSSSGQIETQRQKSAKLGVVYWRIFRP